MSKKSILNVEADKEGIMTHQQAIEEMKALAGDRNWALGCEVSSWGGIEIHGYIADPEYGHAEKARTYAGAIENVKRMLGLVGCDPAPEDTDNA